MNWRPEADAHQCLIEGIDFVVRVGLNDCAIEFAKGKPLQEISGASYWSGGQEVNNAIGRR